MTDWIKRNQQGLFTGIIFTFCFSLLISSSIIPVRSSDSFWHLKMGLDLIENGLSPFIDHYSFTFLGQPVIGAPYIFQIILAFFVSIFGLTTGYQLLRIFSIFLLFFAFYRFFKYIKTPWPIIVLVLPFIAIFSQTRLLVRPELFDYPLIILALILYLKAKESFSNKNLSYIVLLLLFWVNYHVAILGYVIFFGLFLDKAIAILGKQDTTLTWRRWVTWGVIIFLVGFLNPDFKHCFISVLNTSHQWEDLIMEYIPTYELGDHKDYYIFWLVSIYLFFTLLKQKEYGFACICALFTFKSWEVFNILVSSGMVVLSLLSYSLTKIYYTQYFKETKVSIKQLITATWGIAIILGLSNAISNTQINKHKEKLLPELIVDYLKTTYPQGGNILNDYNLGGYLAYALAPEFKIYFDGRTNILYPFEFTKEIMHIRHDSSSQLLSEKIDQYDIQYAIMGLEKDVFWLMHQTKKMHIEFVGNKFILFSTKKNNFPVSTGLMLFPMCWDEKYKAAISSEVITGNQVLSDDSTLAPVLTSLDEINHSDNYELFFLSLNIEQLSNEQKRLLAFIALKSGFNGYAFKLFSKMSNKRNLEFLMMALAAINEKEYSAAESVLLITSIESLLEQDASIAEKVFIISLYEELKKNYKLQVSSNEYLIRLKKELEQHKYSTEVSLNKILSPDYCNKLFSDSYSSTVNNL